MALEFDLLTLSDTTTGNLTPGHNERQDLYHALGKDQAYSCAKPASKIKPQRLQEQT